VRTYSQTTRFGRDSSREIFVHINSDWSGEASVTVIRYFAGEKKREVTFWLAAASLLDGDDCGVVEANKLEVAEWGAVVAFATQCAMRDMAIAAVENLSSTPKDRL
jgi:hypothetical protein